MTAARARGGPASAGPPGFAPRRRRPSCSDTRRSMGGARARFAPRVNDAGAEDAGAKDSDACDSRASGVDVGRRGSVGAQMTGAHATLELGGAMAVAEGSIGESLQSGGNRTPAPTRHRNIHPIPSVRDRHRGA